MDLQLTGKTAVVTGASRGIGLATVSALIGEGMRVVGAARTITPELKESGAVPVAVDLSEPDGPARLIEQAVAAFGGLDVLVNNVGGGDSTAQAAGVLELSDQQWIEMYELNFLSAVRASRAALPHLVERRGALVTLSSNGARVPHAGPIAYTTAKAALTAFGKALAEEFGPQGVRVNTVSPGPVRTALWEAPDSFAADLATKAGVTHEQLLAAVPASAGMLTGRFVEPAEVATLVAYLASPLSESILGADHVIDAGSIKTV